MEWGIAMKLYIMRKVKPQIEMFQHLLLLINNMHSI
jgi:hypothetical protein